MTALIHQSADEVIERLGFNAVEYINVRINQMLDQGMSRRVDEAYLLLNEVERLLGSEQA